MFYTAIVYLVFMTLMRFVFFYYFKMSSYTLGNSWDAFLLGLNYDVRIICGIVLFPFLIGNLYLTYRSNRKLTAMSWVRVGIALLIMVLLLLFMKKGHMQPVALTLMGVLFALILVWLFTTGNCNPFEHRISRRIFKIWFFLASLLLVLFYTFDFQHYDYLQQRLSASILNYTDNAKISMSMIWESYPVFTLLLLIIVCTALLYWLIIRRFRKIRGFHYAGTPLARILTGIIFTLLLALGIFGRFNQYPLRWSDAFSFEDDFKANLALNPVQSFLSTLQFRNSGYDIKEVRKVYPLISEYLHVRDKDSLNLNYQRKFTFTDTTRKPNVVILICESFSMYKSSMSGNPLNATPYFDSLCNQGIFFDRCFTPAYGTARGIWATLTGTPDVEYPNTSSRNPSYVDQHSIVNDYKGYEKFYFIGGSSSWANIRGLLTNNLHNIQLLEEENFKAQKVDVWGISDKRLMLAANERFSQQTRPFVAVIQTADNHRPYTIPAEDKDEFKLVEYPKDTLHKYGFTSNDELNAFRYTDFAFRKFIEAAKKEPYFDNTIFAFVGDHGIRGYAGAEFPDSWQRTGLTIHHVPLLFYSPAFLQPMRSHNICSQTDLLPTVTSMARVNYTNTSMGRNLFDTLQPDVRFQHNAFTYDPTIRQIGMVTDRYTYTKSLISGKEEFLSVLSDEPLPSSPSVAADLEAIRTLTMGWYQTAKYLLFQNKKENVK